MVVRRRMSKLKVERRGAREPGSPEQGEDELTRIPEDVEEECGAR
jgi:hypothetical protein